MIRIRLRFSADCRVLLFFCALIIICALPSELEIQERVVAVSYQRDRCKDQQYNRTDNIVNINQSNTHKINLDEKNIVDLAQNKILIFLHKVTQEKKSKDISNAQSTQVIQTKDTILGYCSLEMHKIFLSDDFRFYGKINLIEKNVNKDEEKNKKKKNTK